MTVYIDDMQRPARVRNGTGFVTGTWSHLMADTTEELVAFAKRIGMNPRWIQKAGTPIEHFDVTEPRRQHALRLGAVAIRYGHEGAALTRAKRDGVPFDLEAWRAARPDGREPTDAISSQPHTESP